MTFYFWFPISRYVLPNLSTVNNFNHTLIQPFCTGLKTSSPCWFLNMFRLRCVADRMWSKGNERTLHHFIKHDGLILEKCINVTAKHNLITKYSEYVQNYISGVRYHFHEIFILYFIIFVVRSCGQIRPAALTVYWWWLALWQPFHVRGHQSET